MSKTPEQMDMEFAKAESALKELVRPYYDDNDAAHRMDHCEEVVSNIDYVCRSIAVTPYVHRLATIAAYAHDVHSDQRKNHHTLAGEWVLNQSEYLQDLFDIDEADVKTIAKACEEHRASYNGEYSNLVSEILSAADRGPVKPLFVILRRSYAYATGKLGKTSPDAKVHAMEHMKDKFGRDGYAVRNEVWYKAYGRGLEDLYKEIDNIPKHPTANDYDRVIDGKVCRTPGALFSTEISGHITSVSVQHPMPLELTEAEAIALEGEMHDALEDVLARFYS